MKSFRRLLSLMTISLVCASLFAQTADEELQQLRQNYYHSLLSTGDEAASLIELLSAIKPETEVSDQIVTELQQRYPFNSDKIKFYLETIREDGTWPDINYADQKRSGWDLRQHADRVLELAKLYRAEEESCHWGPQIEKVIHQALGYWFREKPVCKNWWYNQIGIPKTFGPAFLLFADQLTPTEKNAAIELMQHAKFGMTGQNKVWLAGNVLMRGLLQNDYSVVKAARDTIASEIITGLKEGIKGDWSFHQHGPQQQFGNYGLAYLSEMSSFSELFAGTVFAFDKVQQDILNSFLLEGYNWTLWRGYLDINCLDRQLFHSAPVHKALSVGFAANALMKGCSPEDAKDIKALLRDNFVPLAQGSNFAGHKHFWESDQTIHRTSRWMASVKMASERVQGTEQVNEDNLKGYYMADGALYTYRRGDEYLNVFPFWDWRKIPGVTAYATTAPMPKDYGKRSRNHTDFVGGVTDSHTGITAMLLNRDGVNACKSWIFTDKFVLCLGAGIRTDSCLSLTTSVDQRIKRGDLLSYENNQWRPISGTYTSTSKDQRFFHDSTGYILLQPESCVAISEKRSGRWCDFMGSYAPQTVGGEVVSLYIDHQNKKESTYQYLVLPAVSVEETASFPLNAVRILSNNEAVQAVAIDDCFYISAYKNGTLRLTDDLKVEIETPGIYMLRQDKGQLRVYASDPTHKQLSLSLKVNGQDVSIVFPDNHAPGKTINK